MTNMVKQEEDDRLKPVKIGVCKACHGFVVQEGKVGGHSVVAYDYYCQDCGIVYRFPPFKNPKDKK